MALDALHSQIFALRTTLEEASPSQLDDSDRDLLESAISETVCWLNSTRGLSDTDLNTKLQQLDAITAPVISRIYDAPAAVYLASENHPNATPQRHDSSNRLSTAFFGTDEDVDYQMALELNRQFRTEEEERSYRQVQVPSFDLTELIRELGVDSLEEVEPRSKSHGFDDSATSLSKQLVLGPNLVPTKNQMLSNQIPGVIAGLRRALDSSPTSEISALCHLGTSHFSSEFKTWTWGCGYNNAQVLLSYLKEASPKEYRNSFGEDIPSIRRLQALIEEGWKKGIDLDGAEQLRQSLVGTRKWIGTTEIYTLMTSAGFRCLVHDFDFRSPPYSSSLVRYVEDYFRCSASGPPQDLATSCTLTDRPPLYFQHAGHSRTIVGIEHTKSRKVNLILFDPSRKPSSAMKEYASGKTFKNDVSDQILKPYRVSIEELANKKNEYQILRLQDGMMDTVEIDTRKQVHYIKMN